MRVIFMAKDKPASHAALRSLVEAGDEVVAAVVPDGTPLAGAARAYGTDVTTDDDLYTRLATPDSRHDIDLVISFLFWKKIRPPLIDLPRIGCLNFHPAPLPDLRGLGGYNVAILEDMPAYGVSAHFVDASLDTGDLVRVDRFAIDPQRETARSLERKSQERLLTLFTEVMQMARTDGKLPREPQGQGRYIGRAEFEEMRKIRPADSPAVVDRKIRAFWYPPYPGATVEIAGRTYTVIDDDRLAEIAQNLGP